MSNTESEEQQFGLQRLFLVDASFESPKVPEIFRKEWKPAISLDLNTRQRNLEPNFYEVVLKLSVTAKNHDEVAFVVEVQQGGVFMISGLSAANLSHALGAYCPNILFPYAREAIDALVVKGSFPAVMLTPINFDALYEQELARMQGAANTGKMN